MSRNEVFLSVIIPVYNASKYLDKCIKSVLSQTFSDYEVIFVDDGSTDNSGDIIRKYMSNDNRIKYYHQSNGGPLKARVMGTKYVNGKFFTFCDADDYYSSKDSFSMIYDVLKNGAYDIMQFNIYKKYRLLKLPLKFNGNESVDGEVFNSRDYPQLLCSFWKDSKLAISACNKVYSAKTIQQIPDSLADERVFWGDDLILNLFLCEHIQNAYYFSKPLYCYRRGSGSTCRWRTETMFDLDAIKKYQLKFVNSRKSADKNAIYDALYAELAGWFYRQIQDGLDYLDHESMIEYIQKVLELPSFVKTREYYLTKENSGIESINLLVEADPEKYITLAIKNKHNISFTKRIKGIIRNLI